MNTVLTILTENVIVKDV